MKKIVAMFISGVLAVMTCGIVSTTWANGVVKKNGSSLCPPKKKYPHKVHHPHSCPPEPCSSSCNPCPPVCDPCMPCPPGVFQTGPYLGALVGYNYMWAKTKSVLFNTSRASSRKDSDNVIGEIALGWRYVFPLGLTAGFEVDGDGGNDRIKAILNFPTTILNHKLKRNFSVVPSFTFGKIFCCHWHAFVKLGIGASWFKEHLIVPSTNGTFKKTKTKAGFVPEVGLEYGFNKSLSILGMVGYEVYERISTRYVNPIAGNNGDVTVKVTPKFFNAKVGLLYRM
jgi:hypothetical protein